MRALPRHDLFIVYSQSDQRVVEFVRLLIDALLEVGITLPGYEEMDWFIPRQAGTEGGSVENVVNTPMLAEYYSRAKCVLMAARTLTAGVRVELETLASDAAAPPMIALAWDDDAPPLDEPPPCHVLRIPEWTPAAARNAVHEARAWIWLACLLDDLNALSPGGEAIVERQLAASREAAVLVAGGGRFGESLRVSAGEHLAAPPAEDPRSEGALPDFDATAARAIWRFWSSGRSSLATRVAVNTQADIKLGLLTIMQDLDEIADALAERFPADAVHDAASLVDLAEAYLRQDVRGSALQALDEAIALPGADGPTRFRSHMMRAMLRRQRARTEADARAVLEDHTAALAVPDLAPAQERNARLHRAYLLAELGEHDAALADLDSVIACVDEADEYARFSARYQRGSSCIALERWADAVADFTAVVDDRRAPENTRLSARLRRAIAYEHLGDRGLARSDYEIVRSDPRAAESTRQRAEENLAKLDD